MSNQILLIRPGSYRGQGAMLAGRGGTPLSVVGRAESHALSASLNAANITTIAHSPSFRAEVTGRIIAYVHDKPVQAAPELDDIDYGAWAGQSLDALRQDPRWLSWHENPDLAPCPGGESVQQATKRLFAALDFYAAAGGTAVLVTHRNMIVAALAAITGCGFRNAMRFAIAPASITQLRKADDGWHIGGVNLRSARGLIAPHNFGHWPEDRAALGDMWAPDGVSRLGV